MLVLACALAAPAAAQSGASAPQLRGYAAVEGRGFADRPRLPGQDDGNGGSLAVAPEIYWQWADGDSSFTFLPFVRLDGQDSERTHWDVRELYWRRAARRWELLAGVGKVFWGVTESQHLVDVINQTDLVESPDGEDKLGQPMVKLSLIRGWGTLDLFALPGFRERTFPGVEGRLRAPLAVSSDARYESAAGDGHLDWAVRWSHAVGPFDLGASHFWGTSREPRLLPGIDDRGEPELVPLYELIDQTAIDAQATLGSWLWKLEAIHRRGQGDPFAAVTGGFEYTFWGAFGTRVDVGAVAEYLWDERGAAGPSPFADDLFVGTRLGFNDVQSTEVLAGAILDPDSDARLFQLEASRRLGSDWVVELELRAFSDLPATDPLASLRADDYLQLSVQRHF